MKKDIVKKELIDFVNGIKKKTDSGMDKHLCDHLLWLIKDCYNIQKQLIKLKLEKFGDYDLELKRLEDSKKRVEKIDKDFNEAYERLGRML